MTLFRAPAGNLLPLQVGAADIEEWLLAKEPQAIGSYRDLAPQEYGRAFTAAQTAGTDIADDLYFALVDVVGRSGTEEDFSKLVTPILKQKGWLKGDDGSIATRVALIYDTNLRLGRAAGRWSRYQSTKAAFPYLRAFTAEDDRVRHPPKSPHSDHRAWDGIILPIDHDFWTRWFPPLGFRCRCGVVQMTRSQLARYKDGITSDEELADREARLGEPVFASPALPFGQQLVDAVAGTNQSLMPGMRPVDPAATYQRGQQAWNAELAAQALDQVTAAIAKLFGIGA